MVSRYFFSKRTNSKIIYIVCCVNFLLLWTCLYTTSVKTSEKEESATEILEDEFIHFWMRHNKKTVNFYFGDSFFPKFIEKNNSEMEQNCFFSPVSLRGREKINRTQLEESEIEKIFHDAILGGRYVPFNCHPMYKTALIIPYRNRSDHLELFLLNIIPKLKRQQIAFTVYLIEQTFDAPFNRGMVRNIGFLEALKDDDYDCYMFNDVDTLMEDDRNAYICSSQKVRHLVTGADRYSYRLPYDSLIGGAIAFTKEQFVAVNGYSNQFFMWGSEDDNMYQRFQRQDIELERPDESIGLFTTLKHTHDKEDNVRTLIFKHINNKHTDQIDGLNAIKYRLISKERKKLYTRIYVQINKTEMYTF